MPSEESASTTQALMHACCYLFCFTHKHNTTQPTRSSFCSSPMLLRSVKGTLCVGFVGLRMRGGKQADQCFFHGAPLALLSLSSPRSCCNLTLHSPICPPTVHTHTPSSPLLPDSFTSTGLQSSQFERKWHRCGRLSRFFTAPSSFFSCPSLPPPSSCPPFLPSPRSPRLRFLPVTQQEMEMQQTCRERRG